LYWVELSHAGRVELGELLNGGGQSALNLNRAQILAPAMSAWETKRGAAHWSEQLDDVTHQTALRAA
jgi:hypothetical protein